MDVQMSFDPDFAAFLHGDQETDKTSWQKLVEMEGLSTSKLDFVPLYDKIARGSQFDANANSAVGLGGAKFNLKIMRETFAPFQKMLGVHQFFCHTRNALGLQRTVELFRAWVRGDIYLHDSCYLNVPYCYSISVEPIVRQGIRFHARLPSIPPRHTRSFIGQVAESVVTLSQELAGALAIADMFVYYAYFLQKDHDKQQQGAAMDWTDQALIREIENDCQNLVHILNAPHRYSGQSPFTNVSIFDRPTLQSLFEHLRYPDGSAPDLDAIMHVQRVFCNWFARGSLVHTDGAGQVLPENSNDEGEGGCAPNADGQEAPFLPYPFPVVTLNIRVDDKHQVVDQETFSYFCEINRKGLFNFFCSNASKIASCCRVVSNLSVHMSIFGDGGVNIGSLRVVTVNLARIGHLARKDETKLFALLNTQLDGAHELLLSFKEHIRQRIADHALPFFEPDLGMMAIERFFLTFGINGLEECLCEMGEDITSAQGLELAKRILKHIHEYANAKCDLKAKTLFNVEQVPGESLAVRHAEKDRLLYHMKYPIYANQFVALWRDCDIETRLRIDGELAQYMSGGSISHINVAEEIPTAEQLQRLVQFAIRCRCEHFAVNYSYNRCEHAHMTISGQADSCPLCSSKIVERFTRIVGYFTPVSFWSPERQVEFSTRSFAPNPTLSAAEIASNA